MNRRTLLKLIALQAAAFPLSLHASNALLQKRRHLILIELKGGNDGLNTVIPYQDPLYYKLRPSLAIENRDIHSLSNNIALHPSMVEFKEMFERDELALIQGVGYPNPNRSHFRSIEIWDTASSAQEYLDDGWLNTLNMPQSNSLKGVILGGEYGPLSGLSQGVIKIGSIKRFLQQSKQIKGRISLAGDNKALYHILHTEAEIRKGADLLKSSLDKSMELSHRFKKSTFGRQLEAATKLINSDTGIPFFKVSLGSFDTHTNQDSRHSSLLKQLSEGIATIRQNLVASGKWDDVLIMTYSEFGRRASQNANKGTDHGTAAPHFITGGMVKGGIYGNHPSLKNLDRNGDLVHSIDFRSIYHTIARKWVGVPSKHLHEFKQIGFL
ncbi:MAG: DUF1501 domain-containing protein [Sulfurovum sp.]|nr:DUF1501 domain-containing protein [Sulfurovum sp.]